MRRVLLLSMLGATSIFIWGGGCGQLSKLKPKTKTDSVADAPLQVSTGKKYSSGSPTIVHLAQSFAANTPNSLKSSSSLRAASLTDVCTSQYGANTPAATACSTMLDIQNRFFSGTGPTDIKTRLAGLDDTLNSTISSLSGAFVPCLDASRTVATSYPIQAVGSDPSTFTFPPYALTTVPLKSTFLNNFSIDTGDSVQISCFQAGSTADATAGIGNGFGFNATTGTWYLYSLGAQHIGMYGSADQDDNISMWFNIGDTSYATDQGQDAAEKTQGTAIYGGSTGIVQILSKPSLGLIGLAQVGVGIGPGCGAQLLMNSSTLYFVGNVNNYGSCNASDFSASGYNADLDKVAVCMDVSGTSLTPTSDLTACVQSGLISYDDSGNIVSPFATAGLKYLTGDETSTVSGAIQVRAWMGSFFMAGTNLSTIPPLGSVVLSTDDSVQVTGYSRISFSLDRTTAAANQSTSVTALCSATGSDLQTPLTESFQLTVPEIVTAQQALQSTTTAAMVVGTINAAMANTGDAAPVMLIPITATRGTSFSSAFSGTATVTVDSTTVGTATLTLPASDGALAQTAIVKLTSIPTVTATSTFNIALSGTLTLQCANQNSTERTVAVKPGSASLIWYQSQSQSQSK